MTKKDEKETKKPETEDNEGEAKDESKTDDATGTDGGEKKTKEATFTQADLDRIIAERLEREKRKGEEAAKQARESAESKALEEQAKWEQLAKKRADKIDELTASHATATEQLEAITARAEKAEKALQAQNESRMAEWPDLMKDAVRKMDPYELSDYIAAHAQELGKPSQTGIPGAPKPEGEGKLSLKEKIARSRRTW